jgi:uncharacterized membrane protein
MKTRILTSLLSIPLSLFAEVRYTIVNLDTVGLSTLAGVQGVYAVGVNNHGDVALSLVWNLEGPPNSVLRYSDRRGLEDLGDAGTHHLFAAAINDRGQIAGYGFSGVFYDAFLYSPSHGWEQVTDYGNGYLIVQGMNSRGQMVGSLKDGGSQNHAFRFTPRIGVEDLSVLGGKDATAINNRGWVTGESERGLIFLYSDDTGLVELGPGRGMAINNRGVIAGLGPAGPVLYMGGSPLVLEDLPHQTAIPAGINERNEVVGATWFGFQSHAFLWNERDGMSDLNTFVDPRSGWVLAWATGINEYGQIVGVGSYKGATTPFRLDPIRRGPCDRSPPPEPPPATGSGLAPPPVQRR